MKGDRASCEIVTPTRLPHHSEAKSLGGKRGELAWGKDGPVASHNIESTVDFENQGEEGILLRRIKKRIGCGNRPRKGPNPPKP